MNDNDKQTVPGEIIRDGQFGYALYRELPNLQAAFSLRGSEANRKAGHGPDIDAANAKGVKPGTRNGSRGEMSWDLGISTTEQAEQLVKDGWPDGVMELKGATKNIKATKAVVIKRKRRMGAEGEMVDPHKVISGQLETAWESRRRTARPASKHVTIWCEITTSWAVKPEAMMWRGIAAAAVTKLLEDAGYRVTVKAYNQLSTLACEGPKSGRTLLVFTAKRSDEMLNLPRLCYLLAHASAYRTLGFQYKRSLPWAVRSSLGICDYGPPAEGIMGPNDVCINNVWKKEPALDWVRSVVAKVNGNLK